ncbi:aromatic amino acid lyase [Paenibacillus radicis (ex Gao et al. 2016)]|uniref:Histidine ammonia-lyase n=1 Tax=Paenibacillus radicis (ex Gao et al. 2016) TaxID=1737354 RepID=A0A917H4M6_9BACL|nr:aromatic amino acid lyase [Paenibacillus radicis (ex Gao et al. 2016)]GGG67347.1 histidine ammonia-lyase [Paenibacillus radicis (ex Gao et al. 2016)]
MSTPLTINGSSLKMEDMNAVLAGEQITVNLVKPLHHNSKFSFQYEPEQSPFSGPQESLLDSLKDYVRYDGELLPAETGLLSLYLLLNHAVKYDDALSDEWVDRVLFFVNHRIEPCLHQANRTELSAMSELFLILHGEEELVCRYQGQLITVGDLFRETGLSKLSCTKQDTAFITSLCCVSTAMAVYTVSEAARLTKTADICVAMQLEAIRGETGAFDSRLHELGRPYTSQIEVADNVRRLISGSEFTTERGREAFGGDNGPRCQDAISIRAVPQTHGGVRDTVRWLKEQLDNEINAIPDQSNPLLGYLLDLLIIGLIDLGNISERRSFRLLDSKLSYGLPMNLVGENPGFNHGFPVIQASAAGILGEMKLLAIPNSAFAKYDPITKKYRCATFASSIKVLNAVALLNKILGIEMYMAAQGMDLAKAKLADFAFGAGSSEALRTFRNFVQTVKVNRFASPDMVAADKVVSEGVVLNAVENAIGQLR